MYIKKIKTIIYIYCEGKSEKNYLEALRRNLIISENYVLKINFKYNDLQRALKKSKRLEGVDKIIIYLYDSDSYKAHKSISSEIKGSKEFIYMSEENFDDFLNRHKARPLYSNKKPNISRHLLKEVKFMDINHVKKNIGSSKKFKSFKSIYDLLIELFEKSF